MRNQNQNLIANLPVPIELIERRIYVIRGVKVMLDNDLAELYQVLTKNLNKAVWRNIDHFPVDFMFQITAQEAESLRFQTGTLKQGRGQHRKYFPYVFTEQGVAMLSSVLRSPRAIAVNIAIMSAFVKLREIMVTHKDLDRKIEELESSQKNQSAEIKVIFKVIKSMLEKPEVKKLKIGFRT